jgi:hypothetical protein
VPESFFEDPELYSTYFGTSDGTDGTTAMREVEELEIAHILHIAFIPWQDYWKDGQKTNRLLKEGLANTIFFDVLWYRIVQSSYLTTLSYVFTRFYFTVGDVTLSPWK